jgi:hypothetical protein
MSEKLASGATMKGATMDFWQAIASGFIGIKD